MLHGKISCTLLYTLSDIPETYHARCCTPYPTYRKHIMHVAVHLIRHTGNISCTLLYTLSDIPETYHARCYTHPTYRKHNMHVAVHIRHTGNISCTLLYTLSDIPESRSGIPLKFFFGNVIAADRKDQLARWCEKLKVNLKCTLVQALRLCTGRTAHRGSRGIALLLHDQQH